jgi:hypothetical protein
MGSGLGMGLFGKARLPAYDRTQGNPHVLPGLRFLGERNWAALSELYGAQSPSDRFHFVQGLGEVSDMLGDDMPMEADDPRVCAIIAGVRIGWAWRHRGGGRGNEVSRAGADNMRSCLMAAEAMLEGASDRSPEDSTIIGLRLRCEMGLGGDYNVLTKQTARLARSPEKNIFAVQCHVNFVAPKWHGSVDQMWAAANTYASNPHNAAWVSIAARAHVEEWLYSYLFGDDPSLRHAYGVKLHDPAFRNFAGEIDKLFWLKHAEAPLVGSEAIVAHNNMAGFLVMVQAIDLSRAHFEAMGPYITEQPLAYFGWSDNPIEALNNLRRRANLSPLKA